MNNTVDNIDREVVSGEEHAEAVFDLNVEELVPPEQEDYERQFEKVVPMDDKKAVQEEVSSFIAEAYKKFPSGEFTVVSFMNDEDNSVTLVCFAPPKKNKNKKNKDKKDNKGSTKK